MITWGDIIDIISSTFDINQTQIGKRLGCSKSTISRIKDGKAVPSVENELLFLYVFDRDDLSNSTNKDSNSKYYLDVLKEIIRSKFKEVYESLSDCWEEENYKTFVLSLLKRARKGASTKKRSQFDTGCDEDSFSTGITTNGDYRKKQEQVSFRGTPTEQMNKLFEQAVGNYNIAIVNDINFCA